MERTIVTVGVAGVVLVTPLLSAAPRPFTLTVERNMSCQDGSTNGRLLVDDKEIARTLEPAAGGNRIPPGEHAASIRTDGNLRWRMELKDVPGWENVQIHIGNYPSNTKGCILIGTTINTATDPGTGKQTCAVLDSAKALENVRKAMQAASDNGVSNQSLDIKVVVR